MSDISDSVELKHWEIEQMAKMFSSSDLKKVNSKRSISSMVCSAAYGGVAGFAGFVGFQTDDVALPIAATLATLCGLGRRVKSRVDYKSDVMKSLGIFLNVRDTIKNTNEYYQRFKLFANQTDDPDLAYKQFDETGDSFIYDNYVRLSRDILSLPIFYGVGYMIANLHAVNNVVEFYSNLIK